VRSKHNEVFGSPLLTVDVKKQRQIVKCALEYITRYGVNMMVRFDVLGIVLSKNGSPEYQLIEGAFESDF
jgi:Holliday junction resolvase-like predicted endonuclease